VICNKELFQLLLPVEAQWPIGSEEPGSGPIACINEHVSSRMPVAGFRRACWEGGYGQGHFTSYSVFSYWRTGENPYPKGSFAYVRAAFLYVSHVAPVACLGFGEGRWQIGPMGGRHAAIPPYWEIGDAVNLAAAPPEGWGELQSELVSSLAGSPITLISVELANSPLAEEIATGYSYFAGLQIPRPRLIKDLLFYRGIDWDY
jgi:hypothetical protein